MVLHKLIGFDHLIVAVSLKICYRLFIIWHFEFRLVLVLWYRIVRYRWNPLTWINLGVLGIIHKRFVELRLDFSAFIRTDQILTSPSSVDIPPVFVFFAVVAPGLVNSGSLVQKNGHRVFLWFPPQFLMPAGPCYITRNKTE